MLFNSPAFIFGFAPAVVLLFAVAARFHAALALAVLLVGSAAFYATWSIPALGLLAVLIVANWLCSLLLVRTRSRAVVIIGVTGNLLVLGFFKYINFGIDIVSTLSGISPGHLAVVLPLGISFFIFQKISYLVDVYRGTVRPGTLFAFSTYVLFFPQLIAGPIVRWGEIEQQLEHPRPPGVGDFNVGLTYFVIGLAKKVLIADSMARLATPVFDSMAEGATVSSSVALIGLLSYSFQIYFDFSGYSDMAIGIARMFGVRLPFNFDSPYRSTSVSEFWRRWHMTLSRFLRDYLYIPIGGNRGGALRQCRNLLIVMLLGGLWHGAGWTFIVWGAVHGTGLIVNTAWKSVADRVWPGRAELPVWRACAWVLTIGTVVVAWAFFRSADIDTALRLLAAICSPDFTGIEPKTLGRFAMLAGLAAACLLLPNSQTFIEDPRASLPRLRWQATPVYGASVAALFMVCVSLLARPSEYIYFQF